MQQKIMSATYWLLAAKEISFSIAIFQLSDGDVDGDTFCPCATTGPVRIPMYHLRGFGEVLL